MRQIFEILQEERDRILSIHESATKNHYLGEQTVVNTVNPQLDFEVKNLPNQPKPKTKGEYVTKQFNKFCDKNDDCGNTAIAKGVKFEPSKKLIGYLVARPKNIYRANGINNWDTDPSEFISYSCSAGKFTIGKEKGYYDAALQKALKPLCVEAMSKNNTQPEGTTNPAEKPELQGGNEISTPDKLQHKLGSIRYLYNDNKQINYVLPKDKTIFKFNPDKKGATFRAYDYDPTTKKAGNVVYNGWFNCSSGKFQVKSTSGTFKYYSDKAFVDFLKSKCGKAETEKVDLNQLGAGSQSTATVVVKPTDAALDVIIQKIPVTAQQPAATQQPAGTQPITT